MTTVNMGVLQSTCVYDFLGERSGGDMIGLWRSDWGWRSTNQQPKPEGAVSKISTYHHGLGSLHHHLQRDLIHPTSGHHQILHISLSFLIPINHHFDSFCWCHPSCLVSLQRFGEIRRFHAPIPWHIWWSFPTAWKRTFDFTPTWMPFRQVASPKDLSLDWLKGNISGTKTIPDAPCMEYVPTLLGSILDDQIIKMIIHEFWCRRLEAPQIIIVVYSELDMFGASTNELHIWILRLI